jgi:hypothetical protein
MSLKCVVYNEIIGEIGKCNPEFGEYVEEIATKMKAFNGVSPHLYVAEYNYGENIINSDGFVAPSNSDVRTEEILSSVLDKKRIPLILILNNSSEIYVESQPGITKSLTLLGEGDLIGTYESTRFMQQQSSRFKSSVSTSSWQAIAGSKSVFLPILLRSREAQENFINVLEKNNIFNSNRSGESELFNNDSIYNNLRKDAFPIIKAIANISEIKCSWKTRIVVFPDEWISNISNDFSSFHKYIYDAAWDQASFSIYLESISSELYSKVIFSSEIDNKILLDLTQICLEKTFSHEVLMADDPQMTGPFLLVREFLKDKLGYHNPPLIIHPVNIHKKMQTSERVTSYYSTTFTGQIFSKELTPTVDLTTSFFKPMERILGKKELLDYLSELCGYKVTLHCYGRKRQGVQSMDNRNIFDDSVKLEVEQNIDYDHPYLRACIKSNFTKESS